MDPIIHQVQPDDLLFVTDLAAKWTDEIGWLPRPALEFYAANQGVLTVAENGQDAGFIVFCRAVKETPRVARIYQAAICYDLQRRHLGAALVREALQAATLAGAKGVYLWCADELPANDFWQAMGFHSPAAKIGGKRRGRTLKLWVTPGALRDPAFKATLNVCAAPERGQRMLFDSHIEYR